MKLYRFKTRRTTCYFPEIKGDEKFLYGIYTPFAVAAKLYWWFFRNCGWFRNRQLVEQADDEFPYSRLLTMLPVESKVSFCMGTIGPEQKMSMLGIDPKGNNFFAKFSQRPASMTLTRNEAKVLRELQGKDIAPSLIDYKEESDFCFLLTDYVEGETLKTLKLSSEVVDLAIKVSEKHLENSEIVVSDLKLGLSHGDFTPWNILIKDGRLRLIDWEMAEERPLGYDIFTYITQVNMLFRPNVPVVSEINNYQGLIIRYFEKLGISDWRRYLEAFAASRAVYAQKKGDNVLEKKMNDLLV